MIEALEDMAGPGVAELDDGDAYSFDPVLHLGADLAHARALARFELDRVLARIEAALSTSTGREMIARADARAARRQAA